MSQEETSPNAVSRPGDAADARVTIVATLVIVALTIIGSVLGDRAYRRWWKQHHLLTGSLDWMKQVRARYAQRAEDALEMAGVAKELAAEIKHARSA